MTNEQAYQAGLLDSVQEREPLAYVLKAAEETHLIADYLRGWIVGQRLETGKSLDHVFGG